MSILSLSILGIYAENVRIIYYRYRVYLKSFFIQHCGNIVEVSSIAYARTCVFVHEKLAQNKNTERGYVLTYYKENANPTSFPISLGDCSSLSSPILFSRSCFPSPFFLLPPSSSDFLFAATLARRARLGIVLGDRMRKKPNKEERKVSSKGAGNERSPVKSSRHAVADNRIACNYIYGIHSRGLLSSRALLIVSFLRRLTSRETVLYLVFTSVLTSPLFLPLSWLFRQTGFVIFDKSHRLLFRKKPYLTSNLSKR